MCVKQSVLVQTSSLLSIHFSFAKCLGTYICSDTTGIFQKQTGQPSSQTASPTSPYTCSWFEYVYFVFFFFLGGVGEVWPTFHGQTSKLPLGENGGIPFCANPNIFPTIFVGCWVLDGELGGCNLFSPLFEEDYPVNVFLSNGLKPPTGLLGIGSIPRKVLCERGWNWLPIRINGDFLIEE